MPIAGLQKSPKSQLFRAVVSILQHNQVLRTVIRPESFRAWTGATHEAIEFSKAMMPAIRLTPTTGEEHFWSPNAMVGDLLINCEMRVAGTAVDDVTDLWWAIERAIYPQNNMQQFIPTLQQAGAHSGLAIFSLPACDPQPEDKMLLALGQIKIAVRLNFN